MSGVSDNDQGEGHEVRDGPLTQLMLLTLVIITHPTHITL